MSDFINLCLSQNIVKTTAVTEAFPRQNHSAAGESISALCSLKTSDKTDDKKKRSSLQGCRNPRLWISGMSPRVKVAFAHVL